MNIKNKNNVKKMFDDVKRGVMEKIEVEYEQVGQSGINGKRGNIQERMVGIILWVSEDYDEVRNSKGEVILVVQP